MPLAVAAAVARTLLEEKALEAADPFSRRDNWRAWGQALRKFEFIFHGQTAQAELSCLHDGALLLSLAGQSGPLDFWPAEAPGDGLGASVGNLIVSYQGQRHSMQVERLGEEMHIFCAHGATQITEVDLLAHAGAGQADTGRLTAPMPGKIVSFAVKAGDRVSKGQALAVLDAMKMEHTIAAPADGTVSELMFAPGEQVHEGAELLRMQTP